MGCGLVGTSFFRFNERDDGFSYSVMMYVIGSCF